MALDIIKFQNKPAAVFSSIENDLIYSKNDHEQPINLGWWHAYSITEWWELNLVRNDWVKSTGKGERGCKKCDRRQKGNRRQKGRSTIEDKVSL